MKFAFRRLLMLGLLVSLPGILNAQATGRLVGRILTSEGGAAIPGARVEVVGTALRGEAAVDGHYAIDGVPAGGTTIRVVAIGFSPKTVTGVVIGADDVVEQDVVLSQTVVELSELTVTASAASGSVSAALDEQRNSVAIVNSVSSEQIAKSPDGDAAQAMGRVSGATVQDGKYVFVRGLGDRYTQASLNGARIPSPESERKVVPLDLFPSSLLSAITTAKTFTPDQPGDFTGASVNIRTKEFPGRRFLAFSASTGLNTAVTGSSTFFAPSEGGDWLALGASDRALPGQLAQTDFSSELSAGQANTLINGLRNVWTPVTGSGTPNGSFALSTGGYLPTGGAGISYLLSGTYSTSTEIRADQTRALAAAVSSGEAEERDRYVGTTGLRSVLWGGIANLSTTIGSHTKVSLNNTYNRTADNEGRREFGTSENLGVPLRIDRLRYIERHVHSSSLGLTHELGGGRLRIDWGATFSGVSRSEPDRSEVVYSNEGSEPYWYGFSNEAAVRTFARLTEESYEGNANFQLALGDTWAGQFLRVGGLYRETNRDAGTDVYSLSLGQFLPDGANSQDPEALFGGAYTGDGDEFFRITPLGQGGSYTASDRLAAGYAMVVLPIGRRFDLIAGARVEHSQVAVSSASTDGTPSVADPEYTDVLPSVALTWRTTGNTTLRLSASRTLSRPEYRELSPIIFREVIGFDAVRGNPDLQRALVQNYDLRWEFYPNRGEILSVGVFAKRFDRPIERVYQGTSGTRIITYVNALGANNYGIELEARKELGSLGGPFRPLSVFANATIMRSSIEIDPEAGAITNTDRGMVGQAPYVVNAGLTWTHPSAVASATLLYNRIGERISEAGETPLPDVVIRPRDVLDLSLRFPISGALAGRLDAKNLLDAEYVTSQGSVVRESYRAGRVLSIGFNWTQ
jgi:outer membrane receptor protein involved in Fe transport